MVKKETLRQGKPAKDFKLLLLKLQNQLEKLPTFELQEIAEGEWESMFTTSTRGVPLVDIFGPDCESWASQSFESLIEELAEGIDDGVASGCDARKNWIAKLQWAVARITETNEVSNYDREATEN